MVSRARARPETSAAASPHAIDDLQAVMRVLADHLADGIAAVAPRRQPLVPNALLNLAVDCILTEEGAARTATLLHRLSDLIAAGKRPDGDDALPLNAHDA